MLINLINVKSLFKWNDIRILIFATLVNEILQILAKRYIRNHPEFLKDSLKSKKIPSRGGDILISSALAKAIRSFLAKHGLTAGSTRIFRKI